MVLKHPTRSQLIQYAEALVDGSGPIFSGIARHLRACPQCALEVEAICNSLRFCNTRLVIEPPKELTMEILKSARQQKGSKEYLPVQYKKFSALSALICIIIWVASGFFILGTYYNPQQRDLKAYSPRSEITREMQKIYSLRNELTLTEKQESKIDFRKEIEILGNVLIPLLKHNSDAIDYRVKYVSIIDKDLQSAESALKRNPGCPRANELLEKRIREKAEILKKLYLERIL